MLVKHIHTIIENSLYAVQWEGEEHDCLNSFFEKLVDAEVLFNYFKKHEDQTTQGYYPIESIEEAVRRTKAESIALSEELLELADNNGDFNLNDLFKPLSQGINILHYRKYKAKGDQEAPWIRLYAIKLGDAYIITGGGIKLVGPMQDDPDLKRELRKLNQLDTYLKSNHLYDEDAINENDE